MNIKILVATHKKYYMPKNQIFLPLHVGREGKQDLGFIGDNTGDNISNKNNNYCELTGLYWAWKNLSCDYIGLAHYRRYFNFRLPNNKYWSLSKEASQENVDKYTYVNETKIKEYLDNFDIILPRKLDLGVPMVTQYKNAHIAEDWEQLKKVALALYPEYKEMWNICENEQSIYVCNMFITKKEIFEEYMKWLFSILFTLESTIIISNDSYQRRVFGFMSERLFNIFIKYRGLKVKELPIIFFEDHISIKNKIRNKIREYKNS